MHPTRPLAHQSHSLQPVPAGSVPPVSADRNLWEERLSGASVLPEQFFSRQTSLYIGRPVAVLMHAVLEDALACFQKQFMTKRPRVQRMAREAEAWFLSEDSRWPFAFVCVCAVLELEPESIRQRLKRWSHSHPNPRQRKMRRVTARRSLRVAA